MANLYNVPLENGVQLTLQNALLTGETTTITFTAIVTSKLQASSTIPGILVIDRVDANGNETPTKTEYISFTGVVGSTVTGLVRGLAGSTNQDHSAGAIVEFVPDVVWADALNDVIITQHNADGTHKTLSLLSLVSVNIINSSIRLNSLASNSIVYSSLQNVTIDGNSQYNSNIFGASLASTTFVNMTNIPVHTKTITSLATTNFDLSTSNIFTHVLSAATTTLTVTNPTAGQPFVIRLSQGSAGNRAVFSSTIKWAGGTTPTLTSTIDKTDVFGFLCTASGYYDGYAVGYNL